MIDYNLEIPKTIFPNIKEYHIKPLEEALVSLKRIGILCDSQYYKQGIPGAYDDCFVRESVAEKLLEAQRKLPNGYKLKAYDGYRPICIQQRLWNYYRQNIKNKNPDMSEEEIDFKTSFFVSKPSHDIKHPFLHNTGGAIDLTIVDENLNELNMGTLFDDFSNKAWTNHYEEYEINETIRDNRRILYWTMIDSGFTNLPSEWWHYDYGTKFWAYFKNTDALYEGIIDYNENVKRFPLN